MSSWSLTYWPTKLQRLAPEFRGRVQVLGEILGFSMRNFKNRLAECLCLVAQENHPRLSRLVQIVL